VLSNRLGTTAITALAPMAWGTTYLVTTEMLPPGRPLTAAVLRALPAGLLLLAVTRTLPPGSWWWRSAILGTLNIGAFFAFLFIAAYRLPGGVAATIGAIQPLVVGLLAARVLGESLTGLRLVAGTAGIVGVALLVLQANGRLDAIGIEAAVGGVLSMALGIVLTKKWGQPERPLVTTSWQLIAGGAFLLPLAVVAEGLPTQPLTGQNLLGYGYLTLIGAALAYTLWFRGIQALPVGSITFLSLLSPVVAVLGGWVVLDQALSVGQVVGIAIVVTAVLVVTLHPAPVADRRATAPSNGSNVTDRGRGRPRITAPADFIAVIAVIAVIADIESAPSQRPPRQKRAADQAFCAGASPMEWCGRVRSERRVTGVGEVIAEVLTLGIAVAASPFPIIPAILLLFTPRARATSFGFIGGWVIGVLVATAVFITLATIVELADEPPTWASWARIVIGAALVALGLQQWLTRGRKTETPAWMQSIDRLTPRTALRLGLLLSAANPKVLLLTAAAGLGIGAADLTTTQTVIAAAVFTLVASITVMLPIVLYLIVGERILRPLGRVRTWLQDNNAAVMAVVILVIGGLLVVKGVQGL